MSVSTSVIKGDQSIIKFSKKLKNNKDLEQIQFSAKNNLSFRDPNMNKKQKMTIDF